MSIFQLVGLAVAIAAIVLLIKTQRPELALITAAAAGVFILLTILPQMSGIIETVQKISTKAGISDGYAAIMLKAVGIAYITNLGAELCRDAGQNAIAAKVELAGKIMLAVLALPVIDALFNMMAGITF